ncbi:MAG: DUF2058 domain-containing protein [Methylococcales bacterium]|nr:DUF2058 domain-containing protein [Methylococcales bacterium]
MSKQKLSLQDQLLKSGLVSSAKAKTIKSNKHKQTRQQQKNNVVVVDETKLLAEQAQAEKIARDKELNQLRKLQDEQKQLVAQVKQLIELNRQPKDENGLAYNFNDNNKIKTVYVANAMREQIIQGRVAIVKLAGAYEVVSAEVAKKILDRDASSVIVFNQQADNASDAEDAYAAFQIPDDLIW